MFISKNEVAVFIFTVIMLCSFELRSEEEIVDPFLLREVILYFKPQKFAEIYKVQIEDIGSKKLYVYETRFPQWTGRLPLGKYQSKFKIQFSDETESEWSENFDFTVGHYQLDFINLDQGAAVIEFKDDDKSYAFLKWNQISEARSYRLILEEIEYFDTARIRETGVIEKIEIFKPQKMTIDIEGGDKTKAQIDLVRPGIYNVTLIVFDASKKNIAIRKQLVKFYDTKVFMSQIQPPRNGFVRNINWSKIPNYQNYRAWIEGPNGVYKKYELAEPRLDIPLEWPGGNYRFCVSTLVFSKLYSPQSCIEFTMTSGDRSYDVERSYYQNLIDIKNRLFYDYFEMTFSRINYTSSNLSLDSLVKIEGVLTDVSYAKSLPTKYENFNAFYKINLGSLTLNNKFQLLYDLRSGIQWNYINKYPFIYKFNIGLGADRVYQARTDSQTATDLYIYEHNLITPMFSFNIQYDFYTQFEIDFGMRWARPILEFYKSNQSDFLSGSTTEYTIKGIFNLKNSLDKIEVGYLYKNQSDWFRADNINYENSRVEQDGHYLSIGYVMETK